MDPLTLAILVGAGLFYWFKLRPGAQLSPVGGGGGGTPMYGGNPLDTQAAAASGVPMGMAPGAAFPGGSPGSPPQPPVIPSLLQSMPPAAANANVIAIHNLAKNPATATAAYAVPPTASENVVAALAGMGYTVVPGGPTGAVALPPSPPPVIQAYVAPAAGPGGGSTSAQFGAQGNLTFG